MQQREEPGSPLRSPEMTSNRPLIRHKNEVEREKGTLIGRGGQGDVYLVETTLYPFFLAEKRVKRDRCAGTIAEIEILAKLRHPNVVEYRGYYIGTRLMYIWMEYVCGLSLSKVIGMLQGMLPTSAQPLMGQILSGLSYIHSKNIVHQDVKPSNILFGAGHPPCVKLADFGLAKSLWDTKQRDREGTVQYLSPEFVQSDGASFGCFLDVWAVGCTLLHTLTGKVPWYPFQDCEAVWYQLAKGKSPLEFLGEGDSLHTIARDFIEVCFKPFQERPTTVDLLRSRYMTADRAALSTTRDPRYAESEATEETRHTFSAGDMESVGGWSSRPDTHEAASEDDRSHRPGDGWDEASIRSRSPHTSPKAASPASRAPSVAVREPPPLYAGAAPPPAAVPVAAPGKVPLSRVLMWRGATLLAVLLVAFLSGVVWMQRPMRRAGVRLPPVASHQAILRQMLPPPPALPALLDSGVFAVLSATLRPQPRSESLKGGRCVNGNFSALNYCSTVRCQNPSLRLDLGARGTVHTVRLHNRQDCCQDRLGYHEIWIGSNRNHADGPGNVLCVNSTAPPGVLRIDHLCGQLSTANGVASRLGLSGRYVHVLLRGVRRTLHLQQVVLLPRPPSGARRSAGTLVTRVFWKPVRGLPADADVQRPVGGPQQQQRQEKMRREVATVAEPVARRDAADDDGYDEHAHPHHLTVFSGVVLLIALTAAVYNAVMLVGECTKTLPRSPAAPPRSCLKRTRRSLTRHGIRKRTDQEMQRISDIVNQVVRPHRAAGCRS
eukprot:TRINITY_DN5225_c1_g1_i1.p1 TRINITY_DN5225_c1_g1~~TRINITY_DN5225_c1_g1_i1.p1  ORF type:complete len:775 (+),score=167.61 TRINITY_DN5225_c1_g1_i1:190-2514(+)